MDLEDIQDIGGEGNEDDHAHCFARGQDLIYVSYKKNSEVRSALENQLLQQEIEEAAETLSPIIKEHRLGLNEPLSAFILKDSGFIRCEPPRLPVTNIDLELPVFKFEDLKIIDEPTPNVQIVSHGEQMFAYKSGLFPDEFQWLDRELGNYKRLKGLSCIPQVLGSVYRGGVPHGILLEVFPRGDLTNFYAAEAEEKVDWARQLLWAVVQFEKSGFCHADLKCANVVLDDAGRIRVIDFVNNGWTDEFKHPNPAVNSQVFGLGKTVLELLIGKLPEVGTVSREVRERFPGFPGELVWLCCGDCRNTPTAVMVFQELSDAGLVT